MADDYDFQINTLKFRAAVNDKLPYQRSTAPFRKEQFDSAPTVGDQSLTGWWTRGQLSFHKGAGLKYYEVLDGETILNRFQDSRNVTISEPGQVTLNRDLLDATSTALTSPDAAVVQQWAQNSYTSRDGVYYLDGGLKFVPYPIGPTTAAVNITTVGTPGVNAENLCTSGKNGVWVTCGNNVEGYVGGTGSTSVLYTHTTQLSGIAYAKGRLWVIDNTGALFVVPAVTSGASTALSASTGTLEGTTAPRVTESPSSVYISVRTNRIFRVSVGSDGAVPTLTAPVAAGELPAGEIVTAMRYYLGCLVLTTSSGFRVALVSDDGGLLFGPILKKLDYDSFGTSIGVRGTSAFFVQQTSKGTTGGASIYEVDLAQPVGDIPGQYAWCEYTQYDATNSDYAGVTDIYDGFLVFGKDTLKYTSASGILASSGYVTTGYHRFGTLDPKSFQTVSVRCGGAGGSISVYRVDANGTETLLEHTHPVTGVVTTTITPAEASKDFPLGLTTPTERVALKFVLTRDAVTNTAGPELLGYQLKAMPVPERQRLIKWPIVLADKLRLRRGQTVGKTGRAYSDLTALEALESSAAVVTFTDHRTGETGSAYIDSVEFQSDTPSTHTSNGFGGVGYITLRVLS